MLLNLPTQFLRSIMNYFWDFSQNDKRVANWFLMEDVIPTTYICLFYIAFCIVAPMVLKVKSKAAKNIKTSMRNVINFIKPIKFYFFSRVKCSTLIKLSVCTTSPWWCSIYTLRMSSLPTLLATTTGYVNRSTKQWTSGPWGLPQQYTFTGSPSSSISLTQSSSFCGGSTTREKDYQLCSLCHSLIELKWGLTDGAP